MDRRQALLDAAIELLGEQGMHGLTHRAVDDAARLPRGSASNHFRTRDALLNAVVERFAERERANWDELATRMYPTTPEALARTLAVAAQEAAGRHRVLTQARYAILLEAGIRPSIRAYLATAGARVNAWFMNWMRTAGSANPEREGSLISNYWTGIVLHQLAIPDPEFDPTEPLIALVTSVVQSELPDDDTRTTRGPLRGRRSRGRSDERDSDVRTTGDSPGTAHTETTARPLRPASHAGPLGLSR